jgi:hypothetical protein
MTPYFISFKNVYNTYLNIYFHLFSVLAFIISVERIKIINSECGMGGGGVSIDYCIRCTENETVNLIFKKKNSYIST